MRTHNPTMEAHVLRIVSRGKTPAAGRLEHLPKLWLHAPVRFELACAAPEDTEAALDDTPTYSISIHSLDASRNPVDSPLVWYAEVDAEGNTDKSKGPHAVFELSAADIANVTEAGEYWLAFHAYSGGERIVRAAGYLTFTDDGFPTDPPTPTPPGTVYLTQAAGDARYVRDPGTVADNRLVRWDGVSGNQVQSSLVTVDDSGNVSTPGTITAESVSVAGGVSASVLVVDGAFQGEIYADNLTGDRAYNLPDEAAGGVLALTGEADGKVKLIDLKDVTITTPSTGHVLTWNGTVWVNAAPSGGGGGGGSVTITGNDGIGVAGSPGTSITLSLGNITPDSVTSAGVIAADGGLTIGTAAEKITFSVANVGAASTVYLPEFGGNLAVVSGINGAILAGDVADGTTVGRNILKLTNPGAVTFLRMNADNTVTALSDSGMRSALGLGNVATRNVGTSSGTAAAGDDSRFHTAFTLDGALSLVFTLTGQALGPSATLSADGLVFWDETAGQFDVITLPGTTTVFLRGDGTFAASGDVTGPSSSVDNTVARFDSTTGKLIQGAAIVIDDASTATANNVTIAVSHAGQTNSSLVLTPQGTGALIVGPKPDGTATGGGVRGVGAVDLQMGRAGINQTASGTRAALLGGVNNTASAQNSGVFCGSGNTADNQGGVVLGGSSSTCSGFGGAIIGSSASTVSSNGNSAVILGGSSNSATTTFCAVIAGQNNTTSASNAVSMGVFAAANRIGALTMANGRFGANDTVQIQTVVVRRQTTDATQSELTLDGATPTGATITSANRLLLLPNQTIMVDAMVFARSTSGTDSACYQRRCLITRDNANNTVLVGSVQTLGTDIESNAAWDVTLAADNTNESVQILVTGAAGTTINWGAEVRLREVTRP